MVAISSHVHKKLILLDDLLKLNQLCPQLDASEEMIKIAFSHSKELHVKEMEDIDKYTKLHTAEFLEFIARLGVLLYQEN